MQIGPYFSSYISVSIPGGAGLAHLRSPVGGAAKRSISLKLVRIMHQGTRGSYTHVTIWLLVGSPVYGRVRPGKLSDRLSN